MSECDAPERVVYEFLKRSKKPWETPRLLEALREANIVFRWKCRQHNRFPKFLKTVPGLIWTRGRGNVNICQIDSSKDVSSDLSAFARPKVYDAASKRASRKRGVKRRRLRNLGQAEKICKRVSCNGDSYYSVLSPCLSVISWSNVPTTALPDSTLTGERLVWKRQQVETFWTILEKIAKPGDHIVDFGSGTGNITLTLAALMPTVKFTLIDFNPRSIKLAQQRAEEAGLANVNTLCGNIKEYAAQFDIGIAVHACGNATDYAQMKCLENQAPYLFCSCCLGKVVKNAWVYDDKKKLPLSISDFQQHAVPKLLHPRSAYFREHISVSEFEMLSRLGDHDNDGSESTPETERITTLCKILLEHDRNLFAEESFGYETATFKVRKLMKDTSTSPKSDCILGVPGGEDNHRLFSELFGTSRKKLTLKSSQTKRQK